ncbi:TerB family tellurite resistance protein [Vitiosangium sp. GDMCC 1.1324]|uniref:tellurite resistance TerB family protein n=1 Tax=Vitiosangium sp. (strain GDMCC 1.1324) TaxID=2138576 RepID=UPI000D382A79|nr:TerB family tellurite resistance protein [Vitiosangium sp. GDMCC 1.1324]PTL83723.1 hypothetical protein DAT35_09600 [Vitiosangium sp. GDMCC 1.1324]
MIRTQVLKVRQERNAALVEAMLLAAQVDGRVAEAEMRTVLRHALECPELQGERPEFLVDRLERGVEALASMGDEALFVSLRRRLPDAHNRLLAFGLAAKVVFENVGSQGPDAQLLSRLQQGLDVPPPQARAMVSGLAEGVSPTEVAAEPSTRLGARVLELVLLSVGLDASLSSAEVNALHEAQEDPQQMRELCGQLLRRLAFGSQVEAPLAAVRRQLEELALVPSTVTPRREALRLAVRFSEALGHGWSQELLLGFVQELFGLTDEAV